MTPAEKWQALSFPQSVADYGVTMTLQEILQVPEAIAEVNKYLPTPLTNPIDVCQHTSP